MPAARFVAGFVVALLGCEGDRTQQPVVTCTTVGQQCKLPSGPLGVCNARPCKAGETSPCLRCVPQH